MADRFSFGRHYAETLRRWRETFDAQPAEIDALGFDETFRRMWSLYLAYSEAGLPHGLPRRAAVHPDQALTPAVAAGADSVPR